MIFADPGTNATARIALTDQLEVHRSIQRTLEMQSNASFSLLALRWLCQSNAESVCCFSLAAQQVLLSQRTTIFFLVLVAIRACCIGGLSDNPRNFRKVGR